MSEAHLILTITAIIDILLISIIIGLIPIGIFTLYRRTNRED